MFDLFSRIFTSSKTSQRRRVDFASLQVRLTLGVVLGTLLVLGVTGSWMMQKTEQMLLTQHQQALMDVMRQLPDTVPNSAGDNLSSHLQPIVNRLSVPNTWIWFKANNQQVLAQSSALKTSPIAGDLLTLTRSLPRFELLYLHHQVILIRTYPLKQKGETIGQFYVAQDITQNYASMSRLTLSLNRAGLGAIVLLSLFVAWFIRRSLRPLNRLNQATIKNTNLPSMELDEVPTEVRELARTYCHLRDRLSECCLKQQQFTNSISHELRTPLSLVYGYLQSTLKRSPNLTESQQEALSIAVLETENIIQLLQALLEGVRLEESRLGLRPESTLVNPIAEEVAQMVQQFEQRPVQLDAREAVAAFVDPEALRRVLAHLVNNAVRYSAPGQPVKLRLFQEGGQAVIQVIDRGCGIAPSHQSLIFEPLYRVEPSRSRSTGGAGLSLAIVRSLVEGMGGTITVESNLGTGSTFTVTLRRIPS